MKKIYLYLLFILFATNVHGQNGNFEWVKMVGSSLSDVGHSICTDASNNVYITGSFRDSIDFDPGAGESNLISNGSDDIFISKSDSAGNFIWAKSIGIFGIDEGFSIKVDSVGNLFITGRYVSVVDFDPGVGVFNLSAVGWMDIFTLKLDNNGDFVWAKSVGGPSFDEAFALDLDNSGNVLITGHFTDTVDLNPGIGVSNFSALGYDCYILKLDENGNFLWAKTIASTSYVEATSIAIDASNNVHIAGFYDGTADFDPGTATLNLTSTGSFYDGFIQKIDSNGNLVWVKTMPGSSYVKPYAVSVDVAGNVITSGSVHGIADFDPGTSVYNLSAIAHSDIYIQKLDANGAFIWAKSMGGSSFDSGFSHTIDVAGNVYTTGRFANTVDFDPGPSIYNLYAPGVFECFVQVLNPNGGFLWAKKIGGLSSTPLGVSEARGNSITTGSFGDVYVVGFFNDMLLHDTTSTSTTIMANYSDDVFILKMNSNYFENVNATIFPGAIYTFPDGSMGTSAQTQTSMLTATNGLDSIIITTLSTNSALNSTVNVSICQGESYTFPDGSTGTNTQAQTSVVPIIAGCDSIIVTNLTVIDYTTYETIQICNGETHTYPDGTVGSTSEVHTSTLASAVGCDSIIITTLNVIPVFSSTVSIQICSGQTHTYPDGTVGSSSEVHTSTLASFLGCDSIITTTLSVFNVDVSVTEAAPTLTASASGATFQWLDCNNGFISLFGETNASFTPTAAVGSYAVEVIQNNCIDTSICYLIDQTSVNELTANVLIIYPNPASNFLTVKWEGNINSIELTDAQGRVLSRKSVSNANETQFNVSTFSTGVYLIHVISDSESKTYNVIKK